MPKLMTLTAFMRKSWMSWWACSHAARPACGFSARRARPTRR